MFCDLHVHSSFSLDSDTTMAQHCRSALERGFGCVCFTDHVEGNPADPAYGFFDFDGYFRQLEEVRRQYEGRLIVLAGAEISEPHRYPSLVEKCHSYPFDMLVGSVHFWVGDIFPSRMKAAGIPARQSFAAYWQEALLAARAGGFDVFGHFDYPKRFYHKLLFEREQVQEIFQAMKGNNIIPEINCGGLRRQTPEANPGESLLKLYKEGGGSMVTIGSDAHRASTFGFGVDQGKELAAAMGLREVYFNQRQPVAAED